MKKLISLTLDDGSKLFIEATDTGTSGGAYDPRRPVSTGGVIEKASDYLDGALSTVQALVGKVAEAVKSSPARPDEFEVEFGVQFSAEAGVVLSSVSTEANITITLHWTNEQETT